MMSDLYKDYRPLPMKDLIGANFLRWISLKSKDMEKMAEFNIIAWHDVVINKEPKLAKKLRKVCKALDIPIPPRKIRVEGLIEVDNPSMVYERGVLMIVNQQEDHFLTFGPVQDGNKYLVSSLGGLWYFNQPIGKAVMIGSVYEFDADKPTGQQTD